jgi:catechol 2,3-dioxygenase-like lactoylglutathione lyase family enzyme
MDATHRFYTESMGFRLVKAVVGPTEQPDGWAKHIFYDTGGNGLIAFWELHDDTLGDFDTAISTGLGLPTWINHIAFDVPADELEARRDRWLDDGFDVMEIDHGFCRSVYTHDPNGILVEWCADTRPLGDVDRIEAEAILADPHPPLGAVPEPILHEGRKPVRAG